MLKLTHICEQIMIFEASNNDAAVFYLALASKLEWIECVISMKQVGKCPKCGGEMKSGRPSQDFRILKEGDLMGDGVEAFYCQGCGFIELYKEPSTKEPKRWPKPVPEQEQPQQPAPAEEPKKPREREMDKRLIR